MINNKHVANGLSFWFSTPNSGVADRSVVHLPGLPNNPFPIPGITEFVAEHANIIQPQYYGTYDSRGDFVPEESHKIVADLTKFAGQKFKTARKQVEQVFPNSLQVLSCHSFGTFVGMQYLLHTPPEHLPKAAFFFAPMLSYGSDADQAGIELDLELQADFVTNCFPGTFRLPSTQHLAQFFKKDFQPKRAEDNGAKVRCYFIYGGSDPMLNLTKSMDFNSKFLKVTESLHMVEQIAVPTAGHDVASMLNDEVKTMLREELTNGQ